MKHLFSGSPILIKGEHLSIDEDDESAREGNWI